MDSNDTPAPGTLTRPVRTRARHDGWTPQKQHDFVAALAESGCVTEACAAVGMNPRSAYRLRARPDAAAFRQSWDIALDYAVRRLSDAAFSRALNGVAAPVFYQGEQIGERRRFDERLTMFLLRYRDPVRYGAWLDSMEARRHPDGAALVLANALNVLLDRAHGAPPPPLDPDAPADGLDPPLSDGPAPPPPPPAEAALDENDFLPGFRQAIADYAAGNPLNEEDADDTADHWRSPFITRTPRIRRL